MKKVNEKIHKNVTFTHNKIVIACKIFSFLLKIKPSFREK